MIVLKVHHVEGTSNIVPVILMITFSVTHFLPEEFYSRALYQKTVCVLAAV